LSASTGSPTSRPKPPSATDGFARRTEFANPDRRGTCVDQPLSRVGLSKSEIALSKREVWGVRRVGMPSTPDVPSLRYVRGQPSFDAGTTLVPALLGRNPDELENSEDRGSAGGHGNQHVRLRGASIDASKRSARLRQRLLPRAGQTVHSQRDAPACVVQGGALPTRSGIS